MRSETNAVDVTVREAIPLRERKFARTKLALLDAALERMKENALADITVRELCDAAEVSEATFFNYFRKKDDLLHYFIQIWTLNVQLIADERAGRDGGVSYVESIFAHTAERIAENPRVMLEIIAHMALYREPEECDREAAPLTLAERLQAFPEATEAAVTAAECELDAMLRAAVLRAIANQELPSGVNVDLAVSTIISLFFGAPLWHTRIDPKNIGALYASQLTILWEGLRRAGA